VSQKEESKEISSELAMIPMEFRTEELVSCAREVEVLPARLRHWAECCQEVEAPGGRCGSWGCLVTGASRPLRPGRRDQAATLLLR
jgi:hypothetical protein